MLDIRMPILGMPAMTSNLMVHWEILIFHQHAVLRAKDQNISAWLSTLTLAQNQFDLSA